MTTVSVFGGTGFLGRRLVRRLVTEGATVRVAVRHPERARSVLNAAGLDHVTVLHADVRDQASIAVAVARADAVVNAVSAYVEKGGVTSRPCTSEAPRRLRRSRSLPVSPASYSSLASALIPSQAPLTLAHVDAGNEPSSRPFLALPLSARGPCSVQETRCSVRSPSSRG